MSSPSLTLQCRHCHGIFSSPKADLTSLVRCPHCSTAAPVIEFSALGDTTDEPVPIGHPIGQDPFEPDPASQGGEPNFTVRGKWLQFECPHCVRPMRLIAEDAGGLVDCAHCGLELIAPDPAIGRGARLSRASEGKLGSIGRGAPSGSERMPTASHEDLPGLTGIGGDEDQELDPNHSLARRKPEPPAERIRAIKALDPDRLGRAFRRKEVIADQVFGSSDNDWEPAAAARSPFGDSRQDKNGFWIALSIAAGVMVGIVILVVREAGRSANVFDDQQLVEIQAAQQQSSRFQDSFEVAQAALASPDWEGLLPHVRDPERTGPLMREYYSNRPYQPIALTGFHAPVEVRVGELSLHEMKVTDSGGRVRMLVVEAREDGAKLDWELSFDFAGFGWENFVESRPGAPRTVRVIAARASLLDRYFEDAGIERDEGIGIRLWHDSDDSYYAVLPKGGDLAKTMAELLVWDKGRKLIISASFDPDSQLGDRVRIDGFDQTGWVIE